jgi:hypothetical protein
MGENLRGRLGGDTLNDQARPWEINGSPCVGLLPRLCGRPRHRQRMRTLTSAGEARAGVGAAGSGRTKG